MKIHLYDSYGIIASEIVNAEDRTIELTASAMTVKINNKPYPVSDNICYLPHSFVWGMGANSVTVTDINGNTIPCGLIIRSITNDMQSSINTREILIRLTDGLYEAHSTIKKHSELIQECLDFCKYPDIFKKIN